MSVLGKYRMKDGNFSNFWGKKTSPILNGLIKHEVLEFCGKNSKNQMNMAMSILKYSEFSIFAFL